MKDEKLSKSIAVLPFANMSDKKDSQFFADGITEEIINALTRIPDLKVTSRTSSFFYKDKNIPISRIAGELGVSLILEGSIRFGGNKVRVTAQLIQAKDDFHIWSHTWDRELDDIFQVQDEISLSIADKSREYLGHFEVQDHLVQTQTDNFQAYEWFLKGRFHFRKWNPEDAKQAVQCYDKALNLDPDHAESMIGKADALGFLATTGFMPQDEAWPETERLVDQVLETNPGFADAWYQKAQVRFFWYCDFKGALDACLRAKELHPNHPETNQNLSFLYILAGEEQEAKNYLDFSLKVDPLCQETKFFDAYFDYMSENFEQAYDKLKVLLEENPFNVPAQSVMCYCLLKTGRYDEAYHFFDGLPEQIVVEEDRIGIQALASILTGDDDEAQRNIKELEQRAQQPEGFRADSFLPFVYAVLGENEKVYAWFDKAIKNRSSLLLIHLNDPFIGDLRKETKYRDYLQKVYQVKTGVKTPAKKTLMNPGEVELFKKALLDCMEQERPFLDEGLSLRSLAEQLNLHPNKLSWLINQEFDSNFNTFVNAYRIETFKELVKNAENAHLSIMGLAYESGFSSKTVFNTYFKNATGLTPKQYIEKH